MANTPITTLEELVETLGQPLVDKTKQAVYDNFQAFAKDVWPTATCLTHNDKMVRDMFRIYLAGAIDSLNDVEPSGAMSVALIFEDLFKDEVDTWDVSPVRWFEYVPPSALRGSGKTRMTLAKLGIDPEAPVRIYGDGLNQVNKVSRPEQKEVLSAINEVKDNLGLRRHLLDSANRIKNGRTIPNPTPEVINAAFMVVASVHMKATFGDKTAAELLNEIGVWK